MDDCHLLIMDMHASFVIVDVVTNAKAIDLHLIALSSHTSHTLQPLCLAFNLSFQELRNNFYVYRDSWTLTH